MPFTDISIWPIIIATLVTMVLGAIWYSPFFLGCTWSESHNFDKSQLKPSALEYLGTFVTTFIMVWVFAGLLNWLELNSLDSALKLAFLIWLGFITTTHFSGVIWARKPITAYLIDTVYHLLMLLIITFIIAFWRNS